MTPALLLCIVIGISDGDTLTARCGDPAVNLKVRLAEIDAPEKAQPWGNRSRQHLAALCFKKSAAVIPQTTDRYGRTVGRVLCDGTDANQAQVREGMAWVFDKYATDERLRELQTEARAARSGLWSDQAPMPPWEWRAQRRTDFHPLQSLLLPSRLTPDLAMKSY